MPSICNERIPILICILSLPLALGCGRQPKNNPVPDKHGNLIEIVACIDSMALVPSPMFAPDDFKYYIRTNDDKLGKLLKTIRESRNPRLYIAGVDRVEGVDYHDRVRIQAINDTLYLLDYATSVAATFPMPVAPHQIDSVFPHPVITIVDSNGVEYILQRCSK